MARSVEHGSQSLSHRQQKILGFMSMFCSVFDLEELYDVFQSYKKHEISDLAVRCRGDGKQY